MIDSAPIRLGIREALLARIQDGRFIPGAVLSPPELAGELGVSATPVREALLNLVHEGFVDNLARRGFFVRQLDAAEVEQIYPLIWTVEALALRDAPPAKDDLQALTRLNEKFEHSGNPARHVELDRQFHARLVARCHKQTWLVMLETLKERAFRYEAAYMRESGAIPQSAQQHRRIIESLASGKVDKAIAELEANWRSGPKFLLPWINTRQQAGPS